MTESNCNGININVCQYCNGAWINSKSLEYLLNKNNGSASLSEIQESFKSHYDKKSNRFCPECINEKLSQIYTHNVELDLCLNCSGLFFDENELKRVVPSTQKPEKEFGVGGYVASESLFWVIFMFFSGG